MCAMRDFTAPQRARECLTTCFHMACTTYDGRTYDFREAGEFVLARSAAGDQFEIQIRIEPRIDRPWVNVVSAVAAASRGHRAIFDLDSLRAGGGLVKVDNQPLSLSIQDPVLSLDGL